MASLGLWTLPFCSLARISPTFCSVASLPIEPTPSLSSDGISTEWVPSSGDHYNSETAGASCWSPRTRHLDDNLRLCAEDTAPRSNAPRDSGRQVQARPRQEARHATPALRRLPRKPAEEPTQASPTRLVRSALRQHAAHLPASRLAFPASLREQPAQASELPLLFFLCFPPTRTHAHAHTYWNQDPD